MNWITEVLLDIAKFAEENELPKTNEALIRAIKVTAIEVKQKDGPPQSADNNVITLFESKIVTFAAS